MPPEKLVNKTVKCRKCGNSFSEECYEWQEPIYNYCENCRKIRDLEKQYNDLVEKSGLSKIHLKMTMDKVFKSNLEKFINVKENENLFIYGSAGCGKTFYAVARLFEFMKRGKRSRLVLMPELMIKFRKLAKENRDIDYLDCLCKYDAVILDDLCMGRHSEYVIENIYLLLDRWLRDEKQCLTITSNISLDKIAEIIDDRISSRIAGMCKIVKLDGRDYRLKK